MPTVKHSLDSRNPAKPSEEALKRFDAISDADIDYSDIPEITEELFERATKARITVRLDADLVQWFKSQGKGYQTRMNAVLRAFYEAHRMR